MEDVTVDDICDAIEMRSARNNRKNSTWECATRGQIATELGVAPATVSREGGNPDGPLGDAIAEGRVERHPVYTDYFRVVYPSEDA